MRKGNIVAKAEIRIDASVDKVWNALISPSIIKKYMFGADVRSEWRKGSSITWKGEINGKKYEDKGTILEIARDKKLQYSHFSSLSKLPDIPENYHTVTITLIRDNGGTQLLLTQDKNGSENERIESEKIWGMMLESLKKLLEAQER
jgi:uncharacterized protein YndB with AHSA1/START domain